MHPHVVGGKPALETAPNGVGGVQWSGFHINPLQIFFLQRGQAGRRMLNTDWERKQEDKDLNDRRVGQLKPRTGMKPENEGKPRTYDERQA